MSPLYISLQMSDSLVAQFWYAYQLAWMDNMLDIALLQGPIVGALEGY